MRAALFTCNVTGDFYVFDLDSTLKKPKIISSSYNPQSVFDHIMSSTKKIERLMCLDVTDEQIQDFNLKMQQPLCEYKEELKTIFVERKAKFDATFEHCNSRVEIAAVCPPRPPPLPF